MKENGLVSRKVNKFKALTTDSKHGLRKYPNKIKGKIFTNINQAIVGDVSQYSNKGKDHYIATLLDACNREVIGKAISLKNDTELVLAALEDAVKTRGHASLKFCYHHTDTDVRYCSKKYTDRLEELGMDISMCKGNAYENAIAESFFKTIKYQEINISEYKDSMDSVVQIFKYIDKYNERRPHSALGGLSPKEFRINLLKSEKKEDF